MAVRERLTTRLDVDTAARYASLFTTERRSSITLPSMVPTEPRHGLHLLSSPGHTSTSPTRDPPSRPLWSPTSPRYERGFLERSSTSREPTETFPDDSRPVDYTSRNSPSPPYSRTSPTPTRTSIFAPTPTSMFAPTPTSMFASTLTSRFVPTPTSPTYGPTSPGSSPTLANATWGWRQASTTPAYVAAQRVQTASPVNRRASNSPGSQSNSSYVDSSEDSDEMDESA